jgi:hypothetical protein
MRKIYAVILALAMALMLLAGCGGPAQPETAAAPEVTATPEPPSTVPDPTPAPTAEPEPETAGEKNRMYELLTGVFDNYHAGVAGSSLTAAWYAASIVDWTAKNGTEAALLGANAWDRGTETDFGESFHDKLSLMYSTALAMTGSYKGVLSDCGYEGDWDYTARDVRAAFEPLFAALGMDSPVLLLVWYPNDNADGFNAAVAEVADLSAKTLSDALTEYAGFNHDALESLETENGTVRAALSEHFWQQVCSQGTTGEAMLLGSLTRTLLDAFGADAVVITVNGAVPETGHSIYDFPLERDTY